MNPKEILFFLSLCIPFFFLTIWAVVNAAQKEFGSLKKKVVWMLIASIPFIGFIIYLTFGFRKGKKN
ncbi:MAG: PLDc N-terminal domain-containing protein [Deltaproteobacteria bacterium]|nr:PLDc N-terminal domain-containing protein [Deltaproteobacteria bacterium]